MQEPRIDHLRRSIAAVGEEQTAYWNFFEPFATELVDRLAEYLGEPSSVSLAPIDGHFDFDRGRWGTGCLRLHMGRMVIPLMVRLRNLKDDGNLTLRVRLRCLLDGDVVVADFEGQAALSVRRDDFESLLKYVYEYLCVACSRSNWFAENPGDYRDTAMGFCASARSGLTSR